MIDPQNSANSIPAPTRELSRRERLSLLCSYNEAYLQWQAETLLSDMGWALSSALLAFVKLRTNGEISRKNLGRLPQWVLAHTFTDEQFDNFYTTLMTWVGRL